MQTTATNSGTYGLGLFIENEHGRNIVEHDGEDPGHRSHFIRYPDQKLAIALLGNVQASTYTGILVRKVAEVYLKAPTATPRRRVREAPAAQALAAAPAHLADYAGRYYSDEVDNVLDIVVKGSSLAMSHRKYAPAALTPVSADKFSMKGFSVVLPSATVQFSRDAHHKVDGFSLDDTSGEDRLRDFRFTKLP
jgi:hypothetical protein